MQEQVVSSPAAHGHAPLSPSAAHRWSKCPASIPMSRGYADNSTAAAAEGTAAHALAEAALRWRYEDDLDPQGWVDRLSLWDDTYAETYDRVELARFVQEYEQIIMSIAGAYKAFNPVYIEVFGETDIDDCYGTSDCVILDYNRKTLWVCDYKNGRNKVVAERNPQLALYGDAMLKRFDPLGNAFTTVKLLICQPHCGSAEVWETLPRDILLMTGYLKARAELTESPEPVFQPSESACRFCRFKNDCSARAKWRVSELFGTPRAKDVTASVPGMMSDEALAEYVADADAIERWCKDVKRIGGERFADDESVPRGFHIEERRRLKIVDQEAAAEKLAKAGIEAKEYKMKSITKLKKELGTKEALQFLLGDAVAETTVRQLVPDDTDTVY